MPQVKRPHIRDLARRAYRRLDSNLRARLLVPSALLTAGVLAGMVLAAVVLHGRDLAASRAEREQLFAALAGEAIASHMIEVGNRELQNLVEEVSSHRQDLAGVLVLDERGVVVTALDPAAIGTTPWRPELLTTGRPFTSALGNSFAIVRPLVNEPRCAECHGHLSAVNGFVDLRFSHARMAATDRQLTLILGVLAFIALLAIFGMSWVLLGREAVKPIQQLVANMRRAEAGDTSVVADNGRPDEFGVASRGFDSMLDALRESQAELQRVHEERMIKADRFAMIGQMASGLAHEIKNPLAGLSGALELLAEEMEDSPHRAQMIAEMQHQVTRLEGIMEGLLGFARPPKAQLRATDVNAALSKVLFLLAQQRRYGKVTVVNELSPTVPPVRGDAGQLEQIFLNICLNAYQAMGEGGGTLTVRSEARGQQVIITVADTGPGISPDVRASIFTPFFTTRANGTGLGLATSVRMVAQHGGLIEFHCPDTGGTVFTVSLPQQLPSPKPSGPTARTS